MQLSDQDDFAHVQSLEVLPRTNSREKLEANKVANKTVSSSRQVRQSTRLQDQYSLNSDFIEDQIMGPDDLIGPRMSLAKLQQLKTQADFSKNVLKWSNRSNVSMSATAKLQSKSGTSRPSYR